VQGTVVEVRVFNRHGVDKDERALAIEREEIERLAKDRDDEQAILDRNVYGRLAELLERKVGIAGPKGFKKDTHLSRAVLEEYPRSQWWQFAVSNDKLMSEIEAIRKQYDESKKGLEQRFLDFIYQPIQGAEGEPASGVFVQGYDVTEQRRAEEYQQLLINELNHRVKNTLSIVQALAMQSFNVRMEPEIARKTFDARLNALSAAHNLLTTQNWENAGLLETIKASIAATTGANVDRVRLQGPDTVVAPQTAVSLAMAIHELCTNAIKYGALSNGTGTVDVRWNVQPVEDGPTELEIEWTEAGGPPVQQPSRRGFGTRLIERGLSAELRSEVELEFRPTGLNCKILAKLPRIPE